MLFNCFFLVNIQSISPVDTHILGSRLVVCANCVAGKVHALHIADGKLSSISLGLDVVLFSICSAQGCSSDSIICTRPWTGIGNFIAVSIADNIELIVIVALTSVLRILVVLQVGLVILLLPGHISVRFQSKIE